MISGFEAVLCRWHVPAAKLSARRIHDDGHAGERDDAANDVEAVRLHSVDEPAPENGERNENSSVRGVNAPKVSFRLQHGDNAVNDEDGGAGETEEQAAPFAEPEPHEIAAPDFAEAGKQKIEQRFDDEHGRIPIRMIILGKV